DALFGATNGQVTIFTNAVDHYTAFGAVPYRVVNAGDAQIVKDEKIARNTALVRLWALRELMRAEIPDQYEDLYFIPRLLGGSPALQAVYRARVESLIPSSNPTDAEKLGNVKRLSQERAAAECLYMILTTPFGDEGAGGGTIAQSYVGDTDGDGMPEFIDGWGRAISFIRWPAGFVSDIQPPDPLIPASGGGAPYAFKTLDQLDPYGLESRADYQTGDSPVNDQQRGYLVMPLIFSAGQDGEFGIFGGTRDLSSLSNLSDLLVGLAYFHNPYAFLDDNGTYRQRGAVDSTDGADLDNITNHLLQTQ
ncbi:MAG: hypothetical protein K1X74_21325, partial [Pirellulales bacterium]|nr:hypothetical protein [Pirellulales bacterium]